MLRLYNKMPIVLTAEDIEFMTGGDDTKMLVSEDLVLGYIREARRKASKARYDAKKAEYNRRWYQNLTKRMEDPEFREQQREKRRAYNLKKKAEKEAKKEREARGEE